MDPLTLLGLGLQIVQGVLSSMKGQGMTVEQLADAEAALAALQQFHGSPVTKLQLESLRG